MKRTIGMILLALFLVGCEQNEMEKPEEKKLPVVKEEVLSVKTLKIPKEDMRYVAGWLDDSNIVYVDHHHEEDRVRTFNLRTGEIHTKFTDTSTISEVFIHPSKKQLLVKTADTPGEALITIMDSNGQTLDELEVESAELEIKWNDQNASKVLISAFQEDWSYQMLLYDTSEQMVKTLDLADPFPQWFDKDHIVYLVDNELVKESLATEDKEVLSLDVNEFRASSDQLLLATEEEKQLHYRLINEEGIEKYNWVAENDMEAIEDICFIGEDNIIMSTSIYSEEMEESPTFVYLEDGEEVERYEPEVEGGVLSCSPDGTTCLVGYALDTVLELETGETTKWIETE